MPKRKGGTEEKKEEKKCGDKTENQEIRKDKVLREK
jgi:hypothetical protein